MKMFKALTASVVMAAAVLGASASQASTLISNFTLDGSSSGLKGDAPYGQVTVDDAGGKLAFTVTLDDGLKFRQAPDHNHYSFSFNLDGLPATISDIADNGTGTFTAVNGSVNQSPFGTFQLAVDCTSNCSKGYSMWSADTLTFTVSAATALTVDDLTKSSKGDYFAADVTDWRGDTGNIGAKAVSITRTSTPGAVPEPATWAIMLMGFGGLGAMLRQRRAMALVRA
jgi:hypothetical protein